LTALEYVLGVIGADVVNTWRVVARQRRVEISDVEALVSGGLKNLLTFRGVVGEEGHPALETVIVRAYVSSIDPEESPASVRRDAGEVPLAEGREKAVIYLS
jgi:hypothetical protein